jgi:hypothetical protein
MFAKDFGNVSIKPFTFDAGSQSGVQVENVRRHGKIESSGFAFKLLAKLGGGLDLDGFADGHSPIIGSMFA